MAETTLNQDFLTVPSHPFMMRSDSRNSQTSSNGERILSRMLFDKYDKDHGGSISADEFRALCGDFGYYLNDQELQTALKALDLDDDGEITFPQFDEWWSTTNRFQKLHLDESIKLRPKVQAKDVMAILFSSIAQNGDFITKQQLLEIFNSNGILQTDPRVLKTTTNLAKYGDHEQIDFKAFSEIVHDDKAMVERIIQGRFVLPEFGSFASDIKKIFDETQKNTAGKVASYIPQLGRVDPEKFGLCVTSVDGQQVSFGDADEEFCVQSAGKPISYCITLDEVGESVVHKHVGHEPSGHGFNNLSLNKSNKPHNPMINAGAIMCCSLIKQGAPAADRFDHVMNIWSELAGSKVKFDNAVYLSERATADRNFALAYFMREFNAFPAGVDLVDVLEFYFQTCSIQTTARQMSMVAASLASGGVNPITGKRIFKQETVKSCLSLMFSCGMYDFSGEFAFVAGLPAKSGVSGALMVVIPNVMGFCVWSPRLDKQGNSVRGVEFCTRLVEQFNLHNHDSMDGSDKKDPRRRTRQLKIDLVGGILWAAQQGDLTELQRQHAHDADLGLADYDRRTALHLACCEGHIHVVAYLLYIGVDIHSKDRWGHTALSEARSTGHYDIADLLIKHGAKY